MPALSKRLQQIAALVPPGSRVCDIGCDHGYLAIALRQTGTACHVIAADLREKPLATAQKNIAAAGVTGVETRLCDGLSGIAPGEVDTVVIAGLGGEVIADILRRCAWAKDARLLFLLQPMTSPEALRQALAEDGFSVLTEAALLDAGKVYSVLSVRYTGERQTLSPGALFAGKVKAAEPAGLRYITKQRTRCADCAAALAAIPEEREKYLFYRQVEKELTEILQLQK